MSRYGPHDPAHAPTTQTVHRAENGRRVDVVTSVPAALVKQRRDLNNRAWKDNAK